MVSNSLGCRRRTFPTNEISLNFMTASCLGLPLHSSMVVIADSLLVISFISRHAWPTLYTVSQKNAPPLACYNFDAHEWILIFFGINVTDKVGNQKTLYYATSNNLWFCTTWQNAETRKSRISLSWIVLHTMHLCAIFLKEKMSSVMCLIASNICWDSKISH